MTTLRFYRVLFKELSEVIRIRQITGILGHVSEISKDFTFARRGHHPYNVLASLEQTNRFFFFSFPSFPRLSLFSHLVLKVLLSKKRRHNPQLKKKKEPSPILSSSLFWINKYWYWTFEKRKLITLENKKNPSEALEMNNKK